MSSNINNDLLTIQQQYGIVGKSPLLLSALNNALQAAPYNVSVLITGENGVGKEVFHKIMHANSSRRFKKCIAVNCGGLPEGTIDSELFGHVKGAYTGAVSDRKGYFEEANGGTIFLDEVGDLPLATQARLLRVLEAGEFYRMGSSEVQKTDVRIIAATNVDLQKAIRQGKFREDLFYRLSTISIHVPALHERPEDIYLLFRKFANDIAAQYKMPAIQLDEGARLKLMAYTWPGNIRQLRHIVEEISIVETQRQISAETLMRFLPTFDEHVILSDDTNDEGATFHTGEKRMLYRIIYEMQQQLNEVRARLGLPVQNNGTTGTRQPHAIAATSSSLAAPAYPTIRPHVPSSPLTDEYEDAIEVEEVPSTPDTYAVPSATVAPADAAQPASAPTAGSTVRTLEDIEREAIMEALTRNHGNRRRAATDLGISERTIHRKIQDYGL